jgi:type IV pilus assembly protein PilC
MPLFTYTALDTEGLQHTGSLEVTNQNEALARLAQMGYFPENIRETRQKERAEKPAVPARKETRRYGGLNLWGGVKSKVLTQFTRQIATLVEAGLPILRGLRLLEAQETDPFFKRTIHQIGTAIEGGCTLSEALTQHPKIFNKLYVNMVRAGEAGGVLEITLKRLADFMEKSQKIKGKVVAAMFYPVSILFVAITILAILMAFVVPRFEEIFKDMLNGQPLPGFTLIVLGISKAIKSNIVLTISAMCGLLLLLKMFAMTKPGRKCFDTLKLRLPGIGPVIRKVAISRFCRTFGTLTSSGVNVLQALTIVKETSGNVILAEAVTAVHESVKNGETITEPLSHCKVFPQMVVGMVDVGEQTGALPDMLMKVADNYDEEVDNAVSAMTSLLEPVMIVFLAIVVGSIVIALFMPLIAIMQNIDGTNNRDKLENS